MTKNVDPGTFRSVESVKEELDAVRCNAKLFKYKEGYLEELLGVSALREKLLSPASEYSFDSFSVSLQSSNPNVDITDIVFKDIGEDEKDDLVDFLVRQAESKIEWLTRKINFDD